jgi:hypothetical protein
VTVLATAFAAVLAAVIAYLLARAHTTTRTAAPDPATAPGEPRVTVQVIDDRSPCATVQAVAEISDGHVTARATTTVTTDPGGGTHLGYPVKPVSHADAAQLAAARATTRARELLRGAQAAHTTRTDPDDAAKHAPAPAQGQVKAGA